MLQVGGMMKFVRGLIKWVLRSLLILFLLIIAVLFALQFPAVQTRLAGMVTSHLAERTGTEISIDRVGIRLPKAVSLKGVYVEDMQADTLLYAGEINIDVHLPGLLRQHVEVKQLILRDATVNMLRLDPDTLFNL